MKPSWIRPLECQCLLWEYKKVDKEKVKELTSKLLKLEFDNKLGLFLVARNQDNAEVKIAQLKQLITVNPKYARAYNELGMVFGGELQDYQSAI